jgi:hypothetical protein
MGENFIFYKKSLIKSFLNFNFFADVAIKKEHNEQLLKLSRFK